MSDDTYRQCVLVNHFHNTTKVAWIPSRYAVKGKLLRLGTDDGWTVEHAGTIEMSKEFVMQRRDDYRYQRRVSDV